MEFVRTAPEIRSCRISLKRAGRGRSLLYLHGASGAAEVQPFMADLAAHFDVLVPEHPGFGGSDEPEWLENIHDLAYFYLDFLDHLELRNVLLVGSSLGGWLALEIGIRNTSRIAAISVSAPAGLYAAGLSRGDVFLWTAEERVRNLYHEQSLADQALAIARSTESMDASLKNQYSFARLAWEPRLFDPHLGKWLHRIDRPTQIIWGANDQVLPAAYADEFARHLVGASTHVISECGHLPQIEKREEYVRMLRAFERDLTNSGASA